MISQALGFRNRVQLWLRGQQLRPLEHWAVTEERHVLSVTKSGIQPKRDHPNGVAWTLYISTLPLSGTM